MHYSINDMLTHLYITDIFSSGLHNRQVLQERSDVQSYFAL